MEKRKRIINQSDLEIYKNRNKAPFESVPSVAEWLEYWLEHYGKQTYQPNTYTNFYSYVYSHIIPMLGDYKLSELTSVEIQYYIDSKLLNGRLDNAKGLSNKTVKEHIIVLNIAMKVAIQLNILKYNPCQCVSIDRNIKKEIQTLSVEEQIMVTNSIKKEWMPNSMMCVFFALYGGLRIGEVSALKVKDFDFKNHEIIVARSLNRNLSSSSSNPHYILQFGSTKSKKSRKVPMSTYMEEKIHYFIDTMPNATSESLLFTNLKGNPMEPRIMQYHFHKFMNNLDIHNFNFHALRHTFATRALELDIDIKSCAKIMGHASTQITLDLYTHVSTKQLHKQMKKLNPAAISSL